MSYTLNTIDRPAVVYNGENITSPLNKSNPQFGDPCHTLGTDSRNYVVRGIPLLDDQGGSRVRGDDAATVAPTLRSEMHGNVPAVAGFSSKMGSKAGGIGYEVDRAPTLSADRNDASVVYAVENHPADSRIKISDDNVVQTLSSRMGTGGGNVPLILSTQPPVENT